MGKVNVIENVVNVTEVLKNNGASAYTAAQGFTVTPSGLFFAASLNSNVDPDQAALIGISGSKQYIRTGLTIGHCNDCAYYNGYYYVTVGGGSSDRKTVKRYKLDTSNKWVGSGTFTYIPLSGMGILTDPLDRVSAIAHVSGDNFILSEKRTISVCCLDEKNKQFVEFSRFEIDDIDWSKLSRDNCNTFPQGIYYANDKLYKVFSYESKTSKRVKRNDIAVLSLFGSSPSFNGVSLSTKYSCDRTEKIRFEVEGIGSPDNGSNMYMYANVKNDKDDPQKDSIYSITLQN